MTTTVKIEAQPGENLVTLVQVVTDSNITEEVIMEAGQSTERHVTDTQAVTVREIDPKRYRPKVSNPVVMTSEKEQKADQ